MMVWLRPTLRQPQFQGSNATEQWDASHGLSATRLQSNHNFWNWVFHKYKLTNQRARPCQTSEGNLWGSHHRNMHPALPMSSRVAILQWGPITFNITVASYGLNLQTEKTRKHCDGDPPRCSATSGRKNFPRFKFALEHAVAYQSQWKICVATSFQGESMHWFQHDVYLGSKLSSNIRLQPCLENDGNIIRNLAAANA